MSETHDLDQYATIAATPFSSAERAAVYRAIYERRDMRHFVPGTVPDEVLLRLLRAAHHAPSVGFMQPWRFIRIRSRAMREGIHALVEQERVLTAKALGEREEDFMQLKVQGVLDAAEVLIVSLPPGREAHVFGRRTMPEMDMASAACAIQNMWLAARAEGLGMGWVSIYDPVALAQLLEMPAGSYPQAATRWPCCAWAPCRPTTPSPCCSRKNGPHAHRWKTCCLTSAGASPPSPTIRLRSHELVRWHRGAGAGHQPCGMAVPVVEHGKHLAGLGCAAADGGRTGRAGGTAAGSPLG